MLKRLASRLLLFGIPFTVSYLINRPSPPALSTIRVPIQPIQHRGLVVTVDRTGQIVLRERLPGDEPRAERFLMVQ
jgi:hypothetical protein